jgi:endogenous inhibitor of DNA gyrase (YacG/DUF329 family)
MIPYEPPELDKSAFNCPQCGSYSAQNWVKISDHISPKTIGGFQFTKPLQLAFCSHCRGYSLWHNLRMVYPRVLRRCQTLTCQKRSETTMKRLARSPHSHPEVQRLS